MNTRSNEHRKLMHLITLVSFMVNDIELYLDTHPFDKEALEQFEHYSNLRKQALNDYANCYGPLTIDLANNLEEWKWALQPWPWEGGGC